jgi:hypothetical protein
MKKAYITPQTFMVCGAYNTQILAGSDPTQSANESMGQPSDDGKGNLSSGTQGGSSSGSNLNMSKQNAWESWD